MKGFWRSRTFWFQVLAVVVFAASQVGYADFLPDADVMAIVAAVVNVVLRFRTDQAVTWRRV